MSKNYLSSNKETPSNNPETVQPDTDAMNRSHKKHHGSISFNSAEFEAISSETRQNNVKSMPNLKGFGKRKNKEDVEDKNKYDGLVSNDESSGMEKLLLEEQLFRSVLDHNNYMKSLETKNCVNLKTQNEFDKPDNDRASKISFSFPSVIRQNCPHKKHLLCKKFHGEASEERESTEFSTSSMSGHNWDVSERHCPNWPSQAFNQSSCSNQQEIKSAGVIKNDRIRSMLTRKSHRKQHSDTFNRLRYLKA